MNPSRQSAPRRAGTSLAPAAPRSTAGTGTLHASRNGPAAPPATQNPPSLTTPSNSTGSEKK